MSKWLIFLIIAIAIAYYLWRTAKLSALFSREELEAW